MINQISQIEKHMDTLKTRRGNIWSRNQDITIKNGKTKQNQAEICLVQQLKLRDWHNLTGATKGGTKKNGPKATWQERMPRIPQNEGQGVIFIWDDWCLLNHFMMYVYQIIIKYTFNLHSTVCKLYLNKKQKKKEKKIRSWTGMDSTTCQTGKYTLKLTSRHMIASLQNIKIKRKFCKRKIKID